MSIKYNDVVGGELTKWEDENGKTIVGKTVEGVLINYEKKATAKGEGNIYEVRTKNGVLAFFAPMLLHKKLQNVPVGSIVLIKLTEESKTNSGNTLKHFDVKFAAATKENLASLGIEVTGASVEEEADIDADVEEALGGGN